MLTNVGSAGPPTAPLGLAWLQGLGRFSGQSGVRVQVGRVKRLRGGSIFFPRSGLNNMKFVQTAILADFGSAGPHVGHQRPGLGSGCLSHFSGQPGVRVRVRGPKKTNIIPQRKDRTKREGGDGKTEGERGTGRGREGEGKGREGLFGASRLENDNVNGNG